MFRVALLGVLVQVARGTPFGGPTEPKGRKRWTGDRLSRIAETHPAHALLGVLALAACSQPSQPAAQVPAPTPVAQPTAAQTEARAASRDSSATRDQIKGVQGRLARDGFYRGPVDGVWGPATADAVSRYQHAHGFEETGKLNRETLDSFSPP